MESVFKNDRDIARLFDREINKDFLTRDDIMKSLLLHQELLDEADKRFAFEEDSSGGSSSEREFLGIIQSMPAGGMQGVWRIGGRTFRAAPGTQFDQVEGPLVVGGCAKVDFSNRIVREIDSEPIRDCR
jgi:hypothetical protein